MMKLQQTIILRNLGDARWNLSNILSLGERGMKLFPASAVFSFATT